MSATQKPISGSAFGASVGQAAWKTIPSWYVVAQEDRAINEASHVLFISQPEEIARVIAQAANAPMKTGTR